MYEEDEWEAWMEKCDRIMRDQGLAAYKQCGCDTRTTSSYQTKGNNHMSTFTKHYQQALQQNRHESKELKAIHERQEELRNKLLASKRRLQDMGADLALNRMAYERENPDIAMMRRSTAKLNAAFDRLSAKVIPYLTGVTLDRMEANAAAQAIRDRENLAYRYGGSVVGSE